MNLEILKINVSVRSCTRICVVLGLAIFAILQLSCSDTVADDNSATDDEAGISMYMKSSSADFVANTNIYLFDADNKFISKGRNVTRTEDALHTTMKVGVWNIALLSCDQDISGNITLPSYSDAINSSPMWHSSYSSDGLFLEQAPAELRYALLPDVEIKKDKTTNATASLFRNVAKIQVILKKYTGFDVVNQTNNHLAYVELLDVPTTLSWSGKLYPNAASPLVSAKPLRGYFSFDVSGKADTLNFIVPAHRGDDAFVKSGEAMIQNPAPADTSTHKLRLLASMPLGGSSYFGKTPVEIPYVPKVNSIIQINLSLSGEPQTNLDMKIAVKKWEDWILQDEIFE